MSISKLCCLGFLILLIACTEQPYSKGKIAYDRHCASCHMEDGSGLRRLIPPVANSDYLINNFDDLTCIIVAGISDTITVNGKLYTEAMEGLPHLDDVEVANIINYMSSRWGQEKKHSFITSDRVNSLRKSCNSDKKSQ